MRDVFIGLSQLKYLPAQLLLAKFTSREIERKPVQRGGGMERKTEAKRAENERFRMALQT